MVWTLKRAFFRKNENLTGSCRFGSAGSAVRAGSVLAVPVLVPAPPVPVPTGSGSYRFRFIFKSTLCQGINWVGFHRTDV